MRYFRASRLPADASEAFAWHMRQGAFARLAPPWQDIEVLARSGLPDEDGYRVEFSVRVAGPVRRRWLAEHRSVVPGAQFRDVQLSGPFSRWEHTHRFVPAGAGETLLEDEIDLELPLGADRWARTWISRSLERVFRYRHRITADDLATHARYRGSPRPMRVLVSGSSGLIGSTLVPFLTTGGHDVVRLVRKPTEAGLLWRPDEGVVPADELEGFDAVVHLAGESIASGRWSRAKKRRIHDSRTGTTRLLCETIARLHRPPRVLVNASAIGYYGDRGEHVLDESAAPGTGFLAGLCRDWEEATEPAARAGIRVVRARFGVVLSPAGGALRQMLLPFRWGAGGRVGSGEQYVSWISVDDAASAILHLLATEDVRGAVNVAAPQPVTNRELTRALSTSLKRPAVVPLPAPVARLMLGEMADELLLASARVVPRALDESGYVFRDPHLEDGLNRMLGLGGSA